MAIIGTVWASGSWVGAGVWEDGAWAADSWVSGPVWDADSWTDASWKNNAWGTMGWGEPGWIDGSWDDIPVVTPTPTPTPEAPSGGGGGDYTYRRYDREYDRIQKLKKEREHRKRILAQDEELLELAGIIVSSGILD